jgi:hypothetical protein
MINEAAYGFTAGATACSTLSASLLLGYYLGRPHLIPAHNMRGLWPHHDRLDVRGDVEFQCSPYHSWFTLYSGRFSTPVPSSYVWNAAALVISQIRSFCLSLSIELVIPSLFGIRTQFSSWDTISARVIAHSANRNSVNCNRYTAMKVRSDRGQDASICLIDSLTIRGPSTTYSVRIFFIRASGAKGFPFAIPIAESVQESPGCMLRSAHTGRCCSLLHKP